MKRAHTAALLELVHGGVPAKRVELVEGQVLTVGRAPDVSFALKGHLISRLHARFTFDSAAWHVEDLSSNGVFLSNGERIAKHSPHPLSHGDRIVLS